MSVYTNPILVLTGPSGCGKTTITDYIVRNYGFAPTKTCTTRFPRPTETEHSYYFMNKETFESKINNGDMIEYVKIFGHYYGSQINSFAQERKTIVTLNHTGSETIKSLYPNRVVRVFVSISKETMIERITKRGKMDQLEFLHRLDEFEILNSIKQDELSNKFEFVVNGNECLSVVKHSFDQIIRKIDNSLQYCYCC